MKERKKKKRHFKRGNQRLINKSSWNVGKRKTYRAKINNNNADYLWKSWSLLEIYETLIFVCVCDRALSKSSGCLFETSICWYCLVQLLCGVRCLVSPQNEQQSHDDVKKTFICVCNSGGSKRTFHSNEYACATISIQKIFYMNQSNNLISNIKWQKRSETRGIERVKRNRATDTQTCRRHCADTHRTWSIESQAFRHSSYHIM